MLSPYDSPFNCLGNGNNEFTKLQKWLDALAGNKNLGIGLPGTFCYDGGSSRLTIRSETSIQAANNRSFILKATGQHGVSNENLVEDQSTPRLDKNIALQNINFQGLPDQKLQEGADFLSFYGVDGLSLINCFSGYRQQEALVIANCINGELVKFEATDYGIKGPKTWQPGQFSGGAGIFFYKPCYKFNIIRPYLHDCQWGGGIWAPVEGDIGGVEGDYFHLLGGRFINLVEFGIRGAPNKSLIMHNIIHQIRNADVDGWGMTLSGHGWKAENNSITGCDLGGFQLYNAYSSEVQNNGIRDNNKLGLGYPAIRVTSWPASAGTGLLPPHDLNIRGNFGNGGIDKVDHGGGPMLDVDISQNLLG